LSGGEVKIGVGERTEALKYSETLNSNSSIQDNVRQKFTGYERYTETDRDFAQAYYKRAPVANI